MKATLEVGDGIKLSCLLEREISRARENVATYTEAMERGESAGTRFSYGDYIAWCEGDIAEYTAIHSQLEDAMKKARA